MMETACGNGYSPGRGLSAMMMSLKWSDSIKIGNLQQKDWKQQASSASHCIATVETLNH